MNERMTFILRNLLNFIHFDIASFALLLFEWQFIKLLIQIKSMKSNEKDIIGIVESYID